MPQRRSLPPLRQWLSQRETHIVGADTREWLVNGHLLTPLQSRNVAAAGITDAGDGFSFATQGWAGGQILACLGGEGRVLVGGQWQICSAEEAYITPADVPHAYQTLPGVRWQLAWITYDPPADRTPLAGITACNVVRLDVRPLRAVVEAIYAESIGRADHSMIDAWAEVMHLVALRAVGRASGSSGQLWRVWEQVDADLARPWTAADLADVLGVSTEHFRRLCQHEFGRSPMRHVAHLRVRRAALLLNTSAMKIDAIARAVGYEDRFSFSAAFSRLMGVTPGAYRDRTTGNARPEAG